MDKRPERAGDEPSLHQSIYRIMALPGDGIGPEVWASSRAVLEAAARVGGLTIEIEEGLVGGAAVDAVGVPLPNEMVQHALGVDAVWLGAVGEPRFDRLPAMQRPEAGLLKLRAVLSLYANLRPVRLLPGLTHVSPLRAEVAEQVDFVIVRELTGGLYYGTPKGQFKEGGGRYALDTLRYGETEIRRIVRTGLELAKTRRGHLTSVDKANVLASSALWRDIVESERREFPEVEVAHMYVDAFAQAVVARPGAFDVVVTENLFGDILSDLGGGLVGSLGLLPSASLGDGNLGLYEPVHGSAPTLAGKDVANPTGGILSVAMLLRHSLRREREAALVEEAVASVLRAGVVTADLAQSDQKAVGCRAFGAAVVQQILQSA